LDGWEDDLGRIPLRREAARRRRGEGPLAQAARTPPVRERATARRRGAAARRTPRLLLRRRHGAAEHARLPRAGTVAGGRDGGLLARPARRPRRGRRLIGRAGQRRTLARVERVGEHPVRPGPLAVRWLAYELEPPRAGVTGRARVALENA